MPRMRLHHAGLGVFMLTSAVTCLAQGASDVTLDSITVYRRLNWPFAPSVYFKCQGGNTTDLPFVKEVLHFYRLMGNESWQPVARLEPHTCQTCGVYQHGWFHDSTFWAWNLCTANFTETDGVVTLMAQKTVIANVACPECAKNDARSNAPLTGETPSVPVAYFLEWLGALAAAMAFLLIATIITLVNMEFLPEPSTEEEKMSMLRAESGEIGHTADSEGTQKHNGRAQSELELQDVGREPLSPISEESNLEERGGSSSKLDP